MLKIDPVLVWREDSVRFMGLEDNGTRWKLVVSSNNFSNISKLQKMHNVELIPLSDDQIEIITDAETAQSLLCGEVHERCAKSEVTLTNHDIPRIDRISSSDSELELLANASNAAWNIKKHKSILKKPNAARTVSVASIKTSRRWLKTMHVCVLIACQVFVVFTVILVLFFNLLFPLMFN